MTTATATATKYRKFNHWAEVKKLAEEIGVPFYKQSDRYMMKSHGIGFEKPSTRFSKDDSFDYIEISGFIRVYFENSDYMARTINRLSWENFELKVQLWAAKNNVKVEITKRTDAWHHNAFRIVEG